MVSKRPVENVSDRLPRTNNEVELLTPAIIELLRKIPELWTTFDHDALTAIQANALFLLTAAGMVERRGWIRATIANHPTCFELRIQITGEGGFLQAMERASPMLHAAWADALRSWSVGEKCTLSPYYAQEIPPQEWRLTAQGIEARGDLADNAQSATVFDYVLKRGFFGPGYWYRLPSFRRPLDDGELQTMVSAGEDIAQMPRPPVVGDGKLVEFRKLEQPVGVQAVNVVNCPEVADANGKVLGPIIEGLSAKADEGDGTGSTDADATRTDRTTHQSEALAKGQALSRLLSVFSNGVADDGLRQAITVLQDDKLSANAKLEKIDRVMPFPATAKAEELGTMLGVSKQAVLKTVWWNKHRKGEKSNEIDRRRDVHKQRAANFEPSKSSDEDE